MNWQGIADFVEKHWKLTCFLGGVLVFCIILPIRLQADEAEIKTQKTINAQQTENLAQMNAYIEAQQKTNDMLIQLIAPGVGTKPVVVKVCYDARGKQIPCPER